MAKQFEIVQIWVDIYNLFTERSLPNHHRQISVNSKIEFLKHLKHLKDRYKIFSNDELAMVFIFGYAHNPLRFGDISHYGKMTSLRAVFPRYVAWREANKALIDRVGTFQAMLQTVPRFTAVDVELNSMLDQFVTAYQIDYAQL